jgi:hypothetical protein
MRRIGVWTVAIAALLVMSVSDAIAQSGTYQGFGTGFVGTAGGGDLARTSVSVGGAVAVVESSGWGADMEFSFSDDDHETTAADLLTFMLNANWTRPRGAWRPYVSGGIGVLRLHGCLTGCPTVISATDVGLNAGGGAYVRVNDLVFVRGEVKYLWAPGDHPPLLRPDNYGFVRATIGVTVAWTIAP